MEFNVIDENNKFKIGNIVSIFKLPNYNEEFDLFSVCDFEDADASFNGAYLVKGPDGYDYINEIVDPIVLNDVKIAAGKMIDAVIN